MERRQLEAAAANYPYLQGLWTIPLGFGMILAGHLEPAEPTIRSR